MEAAGAKCPWSSFKVPGAGLGITWPSGLCPQRSRFRPTLPGPKDRSLSSLGESVAWLPPLHPIMRLQPGGSVLGMCLLAVDLAQPLTSGLHYYKDTGICHTSLPFYRVFHIIPGLVTTAEALSWTLVHFCCSLEPAWSSECSLVLQRAAVTSAYPPNSLSLHSSAWHPPGLGTALRQPGTQEGSAPIL